MTTAILVIFAIAWNHNVQPVPPEIDLSKIVIDKTTIREAKIILGSNSIVHTCRGSCLYRFIPARSVFYGRESEVYVEYSTIKIESSSSVMTLLADDDAIVRRVGIDVYPRLNSDSNNYAESWIAKAFVWEYDIFHK